MASDVKTNRHKLKITREARKTNFPTKLFQLLILSALTLLVLFPNHAFSSNDNEWSHKAWTVNAAENYVKYTTRGSRIYGHQFGFLKNPESCNIDNLWLTLSSSDSRVKKLRGTEVMIRFIIDDSDFVIPVDLTSVVTLFSGKDNKGTSPTGFQVLAFSNFIPNDNFIELLKSGHSATIEIVGPKMLVQSLDLPSENFSLDGFIAARLKADDWCNAHTTSTESSLQPEAIKTTAPPIFRGATLGMSVREYNQLESAIKGYMPTLSIKQQTKQQTKLKRGLRENEERSCQETKTPGLVKCHFYVSKEIGNAELYNLQFVVFNERIVDIVASIRNPKRSENAIEDVFNYYSEMYGNKNFEYSPLPEKTLSSYLDLDKSFWESLRIGLSRQRSVHYTKLSSPKNQFSVNFMYQPHENKFFDKDLEAYGVIVLRNEEAHKEIKIFQDKFKQLEAQKYKRENEIRVKRHVKDRLEVQKYMY